MVENRGRAESQSRRLFLRQMARGVFALGVTTGVPLSPLLGRSAQQDIPIAGPPAPGMESFDRVIPNLMSRWGVPGGAVAVVKDGRLILTRGYGLADREQNTEAQPDALFRIASLSKPITAVTILRLVENQELSLDDRAFDVLDRFKPSGGLRDERVNDITIRMLLQHAGGWDIEALGYDPMFRSTRIAQAEGTKPPAKPETIIRYMLKQRLNFTPGTGYAYSNFGYCVLGRVIEAVTGESYDAHVKRNVLESMGISRMQIGQTRESGRSDGEVRYYGGGLVDSVFPDTGIVPQPYGGFYLQAMDAHGGWIGSAIDLMRFVTHVDGRPSVADMLAANTTETMTERPNNPRWQGTDYYYALGWLVRPGSQNWWHTGSLPGTSSVLVRAGPQNLAWAALFNYRPQDWQTFNAEMDGALWEAVRNVSSWPGHDLFESDVSSSAVL